MTNEERLALFLDIVGKTTSSLIVAATELERLEPSNKHLEDIKGVIKKNLYFQNEFEGL